MEDMTRKISGVTLDPVRVLMVPLSKYPYLVGSHAAYLTAVAGRGISIQIFKKPGTPRRLPLVRHRRRPFF